MATGRPRIPDELLKNPRKEQKRKSNHVSTQQDIPEPSTKELALWAPLARLCWERVISNPSSHVAAKKNMIIVAWRNKCDIPDDFPRGRNVENKLDNKLHKKYNAEAVLMWLWERHLTKYSVSELYRMRTEAWMGAVGGLNIDVGVLGSYNVEKMLEEFY